MLHPPLLAIATCTHTHQLAQADVPNMQMLVLDRRRLEWIEWQSIQSTHTYNHSIKVTFLITTCFAPPLLLPLPSPPVVVCR